ncbi:hypothetical protein RCZ04_21990 [Capnocytophaga sp. HP1101]
MRRGTRNEWRRRRDGKATGKGGITSPLSHTPLSRTSLKGGDAMEKVIEIKTVEIDNIPLFTYITIADYL